MTGLSTAAYRLTTTATPEWRLYKILLSYNDLPYS